MNTSSGSNLGQSVSFALLLAASSIGIILVMLLAGS